MVNTLKLGTLVLGRKPAIAVVIDRMLPLTTIRGLRRRGADLLEIRVDLFAGDADAVLAYVKKVRKAAGVPLIGTLRETSRNRGRRLDVFRRLAPLVDAVDIEIDARIRDQVVALFRRKTVIISEHDFRGTPDIAGLRALSRKALAAGADIVKIAAMAHGDDDVARLLTFCHESRAPMVAIAMGPRGALSRVLGPVFGSLYTYACLSRAVAPGQIALDRLVREMGRRGLGRRNLE
jgi:3-dehydroquinate dehydratase-1